MPEQDKEAHDIPTRCAHAAEAQGRDDPQLHRPQQEVSILDDLVGEEASLSMVRGSARRSHERSPCRAQTSAAQQSRLTLVHV